MSDQGERGMRWTDMSDGERGGEAHDVWGKVERGPRDEWNPQGWTEQPRTEEPRTEEPRTEEPWADESPAEEPRAEVFRAEEAEEDVKVAPVPAEEEPPQWEGSLFDGSDDDDGGGDDAYVPAVPTGAGVPAKPGRPSSGNWQMPDWMADEAAVDAKLGSAPDERHDPFDGGGRGRVVLVGGVGLLLLALVAAGAVYFLKGDDKEPAETDGNADRTAATEKPAAAQSPQPQLPPDKKLKKFRGKPSTMVARVKDANSGLSYPRLGAPWTVPTKKNRLGTPGWSGQQVLVTEKHGGRLWYGQLLTGTLLPSLRGAYQGPESVKNVAGLAAQGYEAQYYGFPHRTAPVASQALNVDGHQGWLIASYLTYKRDGVRATGELYATAVIDTGRESPAVVFASMPNTHKVKYPDVNEFFSQLKIIA